MVATIYRGVSICVRSGRTPISMSLSGWEGKRDDNAILAGPVRTAQLVTADSYPSTPYCLPIPSGKFPSIGVK